MGVFIMPVAASAGCWDYTEHADPAPRVQICYQDVCDVTTVDFVCSNAFEHREGYAIGWSVLCESKDPDEAAACRYSWQGRPIDPAKNDFITIKQIE